jgi:hypothetical protein
VVDHAVTELGLQALEHLLSTLVGRGRLRRRLRR